MADLCDKACECSGDAECGVTFGEDGNGISLGFDSADDCAALFNRGCEEEEIDGEACSGDVGGAECGQNGLIVPASCAGTN